MAKSMSGTIVEVSFNKKKGDNYIIWKMKFEADQVTKGLYKAFQPNFEEELPSDEKVKLDLTDETKKETAQSCQKEPEGNDATCIIFLECVIAE
jgi:hypothetical protein